MNIARVGLLEELVSDITVYITAVEHRGAYLVCPTEEVELILVS